jgi:hypothetical protein
VGEVELLLREFGLLLGTKGYLHFIENRAWPSAWSSAESVESWLLTLFRIVAVIAIGYQPSPA